MKRKYLLLFINILLLFLITGCWNYKEMENQLLIAGLTIDHGEGEVPYLVTVEIIVPNTMNTKILQGEGYTVLDALRNISSIAGKKIYVGHCKIVIICSSVAKEGIYNIVDILARDHEMRLSTKVIICKQSPAWEIFEKETIDPIKSYEIDNTIEENPKTLSKTLLVNVTSLVNTMNSEGVALLLPTIEKIYSANKPVFKIGGLSVFDKDKLVGFLTPEESKYVLMVRNKLKGGVLLVRQEGEPELENKEMSIGYEVSQNKTKIKFKSKEDKVITFTIKTKTEVEQSDHDPAGSYDLQKSGEDSRRITKSIEDSIKYVFSNIQKEFHVDVFGFGNHLYKYNHKLWKEVKEYWPEYYGNIQIEVHADVEVTHSGLSKESFKVGEK